MRKLSFNNTAAGVAVIGMAAFGAAPVGAMPIDNDFGWDITWNTTLSVGSTWRAQDRDMSLVKAADGASVGLTGGSGGSSSDANNLNYDKGDRVSTIFKLVTDLEVKRDEMGGLIRLKAWHDQALDNRGAPYGNQANGYTKGAALSDDGFSDAQKFEGLQLLDAYAYNSFDVADRPLQVRLGRQVINWGESLFFQGVNQINPLDVPALRRPGAEIKEGLTPVWAAQANLGLGGGASVEGFYQLKWEATEADACGTYWSTVDIGVGADPGRCNKIVVGSSASASAIASNLYAPVTQGREAKDSGEFGMAVKVPVDALDTEFGFYGMNIHARTPIISANTGSWGAWSGSKSTVRPLMAHQVALSGAGVKTAYGYWEYPEDMQVYGVSAATNVAGWSVGAELSYTPNLPVQRNANDLVQALVQGNGIYGSQLSSTSSQSDLSGYDRLQKAQFQINGIRSLGGIFGSAKTNLAGELAFQWNNAPDYTDGTSARYGRAFIFGTASSASLNTCAAGASNNPQSDGCQNDGFVTPFAWGYRLRAQLEYPQIFDSAITFMPSLSIAHDVSGVSADGQMIEDRFQTGLGARFTYERRYNVDINYVNYADWAKYDPLRDHDFVSVSFSTTF